jgi:hypothetical protein
MYTSLILLHGLMSLPSSVVSQGIQGISSDATCRCLAYNDDMAGRIGTYYCCDDPAQYDYGVRFQINLYIGG